MKDVHLIDDVEVTAIGLDGFTAEEACRYIDFVKSKVKGVVSEIKVTAADDGKVDVEYTVVNKFERIRRITGTGCRP